MLTTLSPIWLAFGEGPRWLKVRLWLPSTEELRVAFDSSFRQVIELYADDLRTLTCPPESQRLPLEWIPEQIFHLDLFHEHLEGEKAQFVEETRAVKRWRLNARKVGQRKALTDTSTNEKLACMKHTLENTLKRANRLAEESGKMTKLADFLEAPLASVSRWLAGKRQPSGDIAIRLLDWVEQQESTKQQGTGSVSPLPVPQTQKRDHHDKTKPQSDPP